MRLLLSFFLIGLYFGAGPCLLTCGPLLISYAASTKKNVRESIFAYLLFSFSRVLIYLLLSLSVFFVEVAIIRTFYISSSRYVYILGGLFIILVGIAILLGKGFDHKLCHNLHHLFIHKDAKTVIMLGLIVGLLPCMPLLFVIGSIATFAKTWVQALLLGLSFGLGTVVSPLVVLVILAGFIPNVLLTRRNFDRYFNSACGLIIIILGAILLLKGFNV